MEPKETAIVPVEEKPLAKPTTQRAIIMSEVLKEEAEQRALLMAYVKHHMMEGTDYGVIPGTKTKALLKPGAEKLVDLFRCTAKFRIVKMIEDWEKGFFHYIFRVRIESRDAKVVLAEGFGSGNSREGKYRWRDENRKCPHCKKEAIIKGKEEFGGGWLCFKKKQGCGAKFDDDDETITGQAQGRVENDDIATLNNTILKMAKKRALVDGAIALARCSDMFTQDAEDIGLIETPREEPKLKAVSKAAPKGTPWERIMAIADGTAYQGLDELKAIVKSSTGKTSAKFLTEDDVLKVGLAISVAVNEDVDFSISGEELKRRARENGAEIEP